VDRLSSTGITLSTPLLLAGPTTRTTYSIVTSSASSATSLERTGSPKFRHRQFIHPPRSKDPGTSCCPYHKRAAGFRFQSYQSLDPLTIINISGLATFTHFALWLMNRYFHSFNRFVTSTTMWSYFVLVVNLYTGRIIRLICASFAWRTDSHFDFLHSVIMA